MINWVWEIAVLLLEHQKRLNIGLRKADMFSHLTDSTIFNRSRSCPWALRDGFRHISPLDIADKLDALSEASLYRERCLVPPSVSLRRWFPIGSQTTKFLWDRGGSLCFLYVAENFSDGQGGCPPKISIFTYFRAYRALVCQGLITLALDREI